MAQRARRQGLTPAVGQLVMSLLSAGVLVSVTCLTPARAMVPYVYVPRAQELEGAGLGIAQAAARLLRLGQAADAARLAALAVQLLPDDPRGWLLLAEAQLRSNQLKPAAISLKRAKQLDPATPASGLPRAPWPCATTTRAKRCGCCRRASGSTAATPAPSLTWAMPSCCWATPRSPGRL